MVSTADVAVPLPPAARADAGPTLRQLQRDARRCLATDGVFVVVATHRAWPELMRPDDLPEHERCRLERYERPLDRLNFTLGRRLLACLAGPSSGESPGPGHRPVEPSGKPLPIDGIHFNLSHSDRWLALALTRRGPVGVDIEASAGFERFAGAVDRISHPDEKAWVRAKADGPGQRLRRLAVWTRKEAFLKATGVGMGFHAALWSSVLAGAAPDAAAAEGCALQSYAGPGAAWMLSVAHRAGVLPHLVLGPHIC